MQILELPEEVLVKIFRRCSTYEIFKRLALVCTNFYRISKDAEVIKEIKLAGCNSPIRDDESYKYLYEVIKRSSGLTKFTIEQRADNHKLINMVLQFCPKLHSLTIINCRISTACINEIIECGQRIRTLKLNYFRNISDFPPRFDFPHRAYHVVKLKNLRSLNIYGCSNFSSDNLIELATNCEHLERLDMRIVIF